MCWTWGRAQGGSLGGCAGWRRLVLWQAPAHYLLAAAHLRPGLPAYRPPPTATPSSIYRYSKGQRFGRHIDESNELGGGTYTQYTLLIYLSSCGGGETVFYGAGSTGGGREGREPRAAADGRQPARGEAVRGAALMRDWKSC